MEDPGPGAYRPEFQIVASTASALEEPSSILVNEVPISIASNLIASNCLRNQVIQFEITINDFIW